MLTEFILFGKKMNVLKRKNWKRPTWQPCPSKRDFSLLRFSFSHFFYRLSKRFGILLKSRQKVPVSFLFSISLSISLSFLFLSTHFSLLPSFYDLSSLFHSALTANESTKKGGLSITCVFPAVWTTPSLHRHHPVYMDFFPPSLVGMHPFKGP